MLQKLILLEAVGNEKTVGCSNKWRASSFRTDILKHAFTNVPRTNKIHIGFITFKEERCISHLVVIFQKNF
jgi:hypothetical protein